MDPQSLTLDPPQMVFQGFRIATMDDQRDTAYGILEHATIGVGEGRILWIVQDDLLPEWQSEPQRVLGHGRWLTPGLIDCHTHLIFGGNRVGEWERRLQGTTYESIAREGGGILSTVRATRAADLDELTSTASRRLTTLMNHGVTTVEIKSGYGLDTDSERKMLLAANRLREQHAVDIATTFLGAHAIPPEFLGRPDAYIDCVCQEMLPAVDQLCSSVDVFCESIAFNLAQTTRVFEAAKASNLAIKVHAEQLSSTGAAALAASYGALSADHLEYLTDADCETLAEHGTVATLLPGAFYCLKETQTPPVKTLLANHVPIAVATDCNPGSSPLTSVLLAANMACNLFGLTAEQALAGITRNAARALGQQDRIGMIRPGFQADLAIWDVESPAEIIYCIGADQCSDVYFRGQRRPPASRDSEPPAAVS